MMIDGGPRMSDSRLEDDTQPYSAPTTTQTRTLEQKRALLRRALQQTPNDPRLLAVLRETLTPSIIARAAERGVFIAYARADEIFAFELDNDLRERGLRVWMDAVDIAPQADWRRAVVSALHDCGVLLMVLSPAAVEDNDVVNEWQYFNNAGKVIVPLLVETCDFSRFRLLVDVFDFRRDKRSATLQLTRLLKGE
jgi:hypothetical protein